MQTKSDVMGADMKPALCMMFQAAMLKPLSLPHYKEDTLTRRQFTEYQASWILFFHSVKHKCEDFPSTLR